MPAAVARSSATLYAGIVSPARGALYAWVTDLVSRQACVEEQWYAGPTWQRCFGYRLAHSVFSTASWHVCGTVGNGLGTRLPRHGCYRNFFLSEGYMRNGI